MLIVVPKPEAATDRFFYAGRMGYAMQRNDKSFIPLPAESSVRQHLAKFGLEKSEITPALCEIRETNYVKYLGPLAGHPAGIREFEGGNILVTESPKIITSAPGDFPLINDIFRGLFDSPDHPDQIESVLAWLKRGRENVRAGKRRPTPALAIVGRRGAGKSLAIEIFARSLGGRKAACYKSLCGDSGFNADLAGAELLTIDDEAASRDHRARVRLGQGIKSSLFAGNVRFEGKGRDAFHADPVQSLVIAVNDGPQDVQVLPELNGSLRDKIIITRAGEAAIPPDLVDDPESLGIKIAKEMPGFLHWIEGREIPSHMVDTRGRIVCFWHPDIIEMLDGISPENRLAEIISQCWKIQSEITDAGFWRGTAAETESALINDDTTRHAARTILNWSGATGALLSRLCECRDGYSKAGHRGGVQTYRIENTGKVVD